CLAGYMRLVSPLFVSTFEGRIINIHPSLLPQFPGLNAQRQAIEAGVRETGCTVHYVDELLDHGEVILQRKIEVLPDDTEETLSNRLIKLENKTYVEALQQLVNRQN
ncbi:MAG: formyltransferase family protein, partial [Acidobacteriota bacterium]